MFGLKTFRGGVHPGSVKDLTRDLAIEAMPLPAELVIPLSQHTGVRADPLVKAGDQVRKGQLIGDNAALVTAPVHASSSGEVVAVKIHPHPSGNRVLSVVIKPDGRDAWVDGLSASSLDALTREDIVRLIRQAGLVGLGGAAFPVHVKLSPPAGKKIDLLLINGAECEPYLTADYRLMLEQSESVLAGIRVLRKALGVNRVCIAIENDKPRAIAAIAAAAGNEPGLSVVVVQAKYPQGSEKQLIWAVAGRRVPAGQLPLDVGVVVQNVGTAKAVADAVLDGQPLIERIVTVSGSNITRPANLRVRLGSKVSDVIAFCGGPREEIVKVILGGPMMGVAIGTLDVPVIKGTSGILLFKKSELAVAEPGACIRCGRCVAACPMGLMPLQCAEMAEQRDYSGALRERIVNCIECGACAFACPARRPLVHWIRTAKTRMNHLKKKTAGTPAERS